MMAPHKHDPWSLVTMRWKFLAAADADAAAPRFLLEGGGDGRCIVLTTECSNTV